MQNPCGKPSSSRCPGERESQGKLSISHVAHRCAGPRRCHRAPERPEGPLPAPGEGEGEGLHLARMGGTDLTVGDGP